MLWSILNPLSAVLDGTALIRSRREGWTSVHTLVLGIQFDAVGSSDIIGRIQGVATKMFMFQLHTTEATLIYSHRASVQENQEQKQGNPA